MGERGARRRVGRLLVPVLLVCLAGAACATPAEQSAPTPPTSVDETATEPPVPSVTPTEPPADPQLEADLAAQAEKLAQQATTGGTDRAVLGADISWPQCPEGLGIPQKRTLGMPLPVEAAEYVVIGLTNGPAFYPNPCLADQVGYVRDRRLMAAAYAVSSFPDDATLASYGGEGTLRRRQPAGALKNVGYQQARFNIASMTGAGLETPVVWIDVEPVPDFEWSGDTEENAAVIEGAARGYVDAGYRIGVYSTPYLWTVVVGDLALGVPEWRAAGQTSRDEALSRCADDWVIQGGQAVLGQWVEASRDQNVTCPGISTEMGLWFHQY